MASVSALNQTTLKGPLGDVDARISQSRGTSNEKQPQYVPPAGPPPLPALIPVELPKVIPYHCYNLHDQGWTTVTFDSTNDDLFQAYRALFEAAKVFFNRELDYKRQFWTKDGSEEGWSRIEGEKEFITLRHLGLCPEELAAPAGRVWELAASLLNEMLGRIEESLELSVGSITAFSKPCSQLDHVKRATMMRIFRYENWTPKVVAEPHNDLGLLSLVIGDVPGLEVWNKYNRSWFPVERSYVDAWCKGERNPKASVLVGRQLQKFSNGRYISGGHLVRSYPDHLRMNDSSTTLAEEHPASLSEVKMNSQEPTNADQRSQEIEPRYRFSIVFVLRAHRPVPVDTDKLTSRITGPHKEVIRHETAGELFDRIKKAHFNINIGIREREEQKRKMRELKSATTSGKASQESDQSDVLEIKKSAHCNRVEGDPGT